MIRALLCTLLLSSTFAFDVERTVIVRGKKDKLVKAKKKLTDLNSKTHYDGKYFKIVAKTSDKAIKIDDSIISRKAANVYWHLTKAKNYFASIGAPQKEQITIRIDIKNQFHKLFHFQNENLKPAFNNATAVDAGAGDMDYGIKPWGHEIWFRPPKKIKLDKSLIKQFKKTMRGNIPTNASISTEILVYTAAESLKAKDKEAAFKTGMEEIFTNYLRNAAISYLIPEIAALFIKRHYFLDTAFIPEIIYHEYSHYIMADHLPPVGNNPLIEGYADYFASKVADSSMLAHELGHHGQLLAHRDAESTKFYETYHDTQKGLGSDLVLSVLFEMDQRVSKYEDKDYFVKKMFEFRKILTFDSKIADDLPDYLWDAFPKYQKIMMAILHNRGI